MGKILVPINFSDSSLHGLSVAATLARKLRKTLLLLHVTPLANTAADVGFLGIDMSMETEQVKAAGVRLEELAAKWRASSDQEPITIETISFLGELSITAEQVIESHKVDFVVMGTNGAKGTFEEWMGSNTWQLVSQINVPLFAIPEGFGSNVFDNILYASNLESGETKALSWLQTFITAMNGKLTVLHIDTEVGDRVSEAEVRVEQKRNNDAAQTIHYLQLSDETAVSGIERYLAIEPYDLLAVMRPERGFWSNLFHKSVTKELLAHANIPLLVL